MGRLGREKPIRHLNKQEAIRHLIHTAFRMLVAAEDPFAIHLLVQSADKMLVDLAKKTGKELQFDWEKTVRPERRKEFFEIWRETYNYFKHADTDHLDNLEVHRIAAMNVVTLFLVIENYRAVYGALSAHMQLHMLFIQVYMPGVFIFPEDQAKAMRATLSSLRDMTPAECFDILVKHQPLAAGFEQERLADTADTMPFYGTSFSKLKPDEEG